MSSGGALAALESLAARIVDLSRTQGKLAYADYISRHPWGDLASELGGDPARAEPVLARIAACPGWASDAAQMERKLRRAAKEARTRAARASVARGDVVWLQRGDEEEMSRDMIENHLGAGPDYIAYDRSGLHVYDPELMYWDLIPRASLVSDIASRYAGAVVDRGEDPPKVIDMSHARASGAARLVEAHAIREGFFDERPRGAAFLNGFLEEPGGPLQEHRPGRRLLKEDMIPIVYKPVSSRAEAEERAPVWHRFLKDMFEPDSDGDAKAWLIMQFIGVALMGQSTRYGRALYLYGPKAANGKSTLLSTIEALFAPEAVASVQPQDMGEDFKNVKLASCKVNIVYDMSSAAILDTGVIKSVFSGESTQYNEKNRQPFVARARCGHFMAGNRKPNVSDRSEGFFRRMILVSCNRTFSPSEQDLSLASKLADEAPGIAAACIYAAQSVGEYNYAIPDSCLQDLKNWHTDSDNVASFLDSFEVSNIGIKGPPLYRLYCEYAKDSGTRPLAKSRFYEELESKGIARRPGGERRWLISIRDRSEVADLERDNR